VLGLELLLRLRLVLLGRLGGGGGGGAGGGGGGGPPGGGGGGGVTHCSCLAATPKGLLSPTPQSPAGSKLIIKILQGKKRKLYGMLPYRPLPMRGLKNLINKPNPINKP